MGYYYIRFGSPDSVDQDFFVDVGYDICRLKNSLKELQSFREHLKRAPDENIQLGLVEDGIIKLVAVALADEVNNAVYYTYSLHEQEHENPVKRPVPRDVVGKYIYNLRGTLRWFTRTSLRPKIKETLRKYYFEPDKMREMLLELLYSGVFVEAFAEDNFRKHSAIDVGKKITFYWVQYAYLLKGEEYYTKGELAQYSNEARRLIERRPEPADYEWLKSLITEMLWKTGTSLKGIGYGFRKG